VAGNVVEVARESWRHRGSINFEKLNEYLVWCRAHEVAPCAEFVNSAPEADSHLEQTVTQTGEVVGANSYMVDGAFAIIARRLRVKMNATCAYLHEYVAGPAEIAVVVYFGIKRAPVPGNRTVEIVREQMNVVEVYHPLNRQSHLY